MKHARAEFRGPIRYPRPLFWPLGTLPLLAANANGTCERKSGALRKASA
jgi:hypothetical protein